MYSKQQAPVDVDDIVKPSEVMRARQRKTGKKKRRKRGERERETACLFPPKKKPQNRLLRLLTNNNTSKRKVGVLRFPSSKRTVRNISGIGVASLHGHSLHGKAGSRCRLRRLRDSCCAATEQIGEKKRRKMAKDELGQAGTNAERQAWAG